MQESYRIDRIDCQRKNQGSELLHLLQEGLVSVINETGDTYTLALGRFLSRPWFSQAWVLQEYVLGGQYSMIFKHGSL
jgi:hypothetical protein